MPHELSGIVIIDKPAGISSAAVVTAVKKKFKVRKAGHTGTLDPFATGVLICCINKATRLSRFFLKANKKYEAVLHLGITTDTQDSTGKIISTCEVKDYSNAEIAKIFNRFLGEIKQKPPIYSALKHNGVPLYKFARNGNPVSKPARRIEIFDIKIIDIKLPHIRFEVSCSAGTYIRTLGYDIASELGCGGHVKELKRLENSGFYITDAYSLSDIEKKCTHEYSHDILSEIIIGMSDCLPDMPCYISDKVLTNKILHGILLSADDLKNYNFHKKDNFIKIVDTDNNLLTVLEPDKHGNKFTYCCVFN